MSMTKFVNMLVEVSDPQEQLLDGKELAAHVTYKELENKFLIDIPEKKTVEKTAKPKPEEVWTSPTTGIKATIAVKGNPMVTLNMPREKFVAFSKKLLKEDLDTAFEKVYARVTLGS